MKLKLAVLALAGVFLSSCDNAVDVDEVSVEAEVEPTPVAYYEYLWCKRGENWTMESAQSFVADWNAELDGMENTLDSAFVYVPKNSENQNFDTVWVLRFPDKAAMEKGWSTYQESGADGRLQSMHPGVVECGNEVAENRFGFDMYSAVSTPDGFGDEEPYLVQGQFCNFNDGKGPEDLTRVIRDHFVPEIEAGRANGSYPSYWFMVGAPDFEREDRPDFIWMDYFANSEAMEKETGIYFGSESGNSIQAMFDEVSECTDQNQSDGFFLRRPESL